MNCGSAQLEKSEKAISPEHTIRAIRTQVLEERGRGRVSRAHRARSFVLGHRVAENYAPRAREKAQRAGDQASYARVLGTNPSITWYFESIWE